VATEYGLAVRFELAAATVVVCLNSGRPVPFAVWIDCTVKHHEGFEGVCIQSYCLFLCCASDHQSFASGTRMTKRSRKTLV